MLRQQLPAGEHRRYKRSAFAHIGEYDARYVPNHDEHEHIGDPYVNLPECILHKKDALESGGIDSRAAARPDRCRIDPGNGKIRLNDRTKWWVEQAYRGVDQAG